MPAVYLNVHPVVTLSAVNNITRYFLANRPIYILDK